MKEISSYLSGSVIMNCVGLFPLFLDFLLVYYPYFLCPPAICYWVLLMFWDHYCVWTPNHEVQYKLSGILITLLDFLK